MASAARPAQTRLRRPQVLRASGRGAVLAAAALLKRGGIVAFPTETVYGLAVGVADRAARARLTRVKRRAGSKPFQLLLSGRRRADGFCRQMPLPARRLASVFWPGPLTLVVRGKNGRWVGLRVPDHRVARRLALLAGGAIVATSANLSGEEPASTAEAVVDAFADRIDLVLAGDAASLKKPSTVVRVWDNEWEILREGAISRRGIQAVAGGKGKSS